MHSAFNTLTYYWKKILKPKKLYCRHGAFALAFWTNKIPSLLHTHLLDSIYGLKIVEFLIKESVASFVGSVILDLGLGRKASDASPVSIKQL